MLNSLRLWGLAFVFVLAVGSGTASAANRLETWQEDKMTSSKYTEKAGAEFLNGIARFIAAPFELLYHPYDQAIAEKKQLLGVFEGLGTGVYHALEDVAVGAVNLGGALVPNFQGIRALSRPK